MELHLRPMMLSDAATFASWGLYGIFRAHAGWGESLSIEDLRVWWAASIATPDPQLIRLAAVSGDDLVGYIDLHGREEDKRELGFLVGPSTRWGQGWGTLAASAGLEYGFDVLGLSIIWAEAVEANICSVRVLRRLGMSHTGFGEDETFLGERSVYAQFALTRHDWARRSG